MMKIVLRIITTWASRFLARAVNTHRDSNAVIFSRLPPVGQVCFSLFLILAHPYLPLLQASVKTRDSSVPQYFPELSKSAPIALVEMPAVESITIEGSLGEFQKELDLANKIISAITELEKTAELDDTVRALRTLLKENISKKISPFCGGPLAVLAGIGLVGVIITFVCVGAFVVFVYSLVHLAFDTIRPDLVIDDFVRGRVQQIAELIELVQQKKSELSDAIIRGAPIQEVMEIQDYIHQLYVMIGQFFTEIQRHCNPEGGNISNFVGALGFFNSETGQIELNDRILYGGLPPMAP